KTLGKLALDDSCELCFWLQAKLGFKTPWGIWPGIFNSMDSLTMKVVALHFAKHRRLPTWLDGFGPLGEPIPVPHHSKFRARHAATGLILTGTPDELYRRPDRTIFILDDKTAKFTGTPDALLPMYRVQIS